MHDEEGAEIAELLFNENARSFDMHCRMHHECAIAKGVRAYDGDGRLTAHRAAMGRHLAFLVAWARLGLEIPEYEDGRRHFDMRLCPAPYKHLADGASAVRTSARAWVEASPTMAELRKVERQPRPGEPLEPLGNP